MTIIEAATKDTLPNCLTLCFEPKKSPNFQAVEGFSFNYLPNKWEDTYLAPPYIHL